MISINNFHTSFVCVCSHSSTLQLDLDTRFYFFCHTVDHIDSYCYITVIASDYVNLENILFCPVIVLVVVFFSSSVVFSSLFILFFVPFGVGWGAPELAWNIFCSTIENGRHSVPTLCKMIVSRGKRAINPTLFFNHHLMVICVIQDRSIL